MFQRMRWAGALTALVAVLVVGSNAQAQVKPVKITGGGYAPEGISLIPGVAVPHSVAGEATELGKYSGEGMFQILDYTGPLSAEFSSAPDVVFVAADGDELVCTYGVTDNGAEQPGQVQLYPVGDGSFVAVFVAEFNPVLDKCTGRFAKLVGGSFIMVAVSEPFFIEGTSTTPFAYTWSGEGSTEFSKGK